jgi:prepilin-type N-terminal cleavage/methylation domain-containing protein
MNVFTTMRQRRQKGFTLVELLVVISIIGVLATLVLLQLGTARARARDTKRIADVNQVRTAVELYYEDNSGAYPSAISDANLGKYLSGSRVPKDPLTAVAYSYSYHTGSSGKIDGYHIWTQLEQSAAALASDADINSSGSGWTGGQDLSADETTTCKTDVTKCLYDQGVTQ